MILSIITAVLGMIGGLIPELLKYFKQKQDNLHELAIMKLQIENTKMLGEQKLDEIKVQRDIGEAEAVYQFAAPPRGTSIKIIDGIVYLLNGLVRPLVAYWLFTTYVVNKLGLTAIEWSQFDQGMLAGVAAFYFTNRAMRYAMGQLGNGNGHTWAKYGYEGK